MRTYSIFSRLEKWWGHSYENFFNEVLTCTLQENPSLTRHIIQKLTRFDMEPKNLKVESQCHHSKGIIDIRIMDNTTCVFIELKLDAVLGYRQIKRYEQILRSEDYKNKKNKRILLLTQYPPYDDRELKDKKYKLFRKERDYSPLHKLYSIISEAQTQKEVCHIKNLYIVKELIQMMEDKTMIPFKGFSFDNDKIDTAIKKILPFYWNFQVLIDHAISKLNGNGYNATWSQEKQSKNPFEWYLKFQPPRQKIKRRSLKAKDLTMYAGISVEHNEDGPLLDRTCLWVGVYWKENNREVKIETLKKRLDKLGSGFDVRPDLGWNKYIEMYHSCTLREILRDEKEKDPMIQEQKVLNDLKEMVGNIVRVVTQNILKK
ncbi:MAG: PD-(D/E)XK nuclease family protein [Nitrospirae bacterium]|nr:PD-(D/E)XK nuclease family protein [Nitrospirota bacterium]